MSNTRASLPLGSRIIHNDRPGAVVSVSPDNSGAVLIQFGTGDRTPCRFLYDIAFEDGSMMRRVSNAEFSGVHASYSVTSDAPADAAEIAGLLALAEKRAQERRDAAKLAAEKKAAEIAAIKADPAFSHLTPSSEDGRLSYAQVTANLRKHLKKTFPGVKFSVTMRGGYSSVTVAWTDGPTAKAVQKVTGLFDTYAGTRMDDSVDFKSTPFNEAFGGIQYLHTNRQHSDAVLADAIAKVWPRFNWGEGRQAPTVAEYRNGAGLDFCPVGFSYSESLSRFVREHLEAAA